jgi:hypothetical protein
MKSINHGTKLFPANSIILRNAARIGIPMTAMSNHVLIWSAIQSPGVVLLKPWRSSRTKVW